ncbi:MAG: hypothetical protein QOC72_1268 [Methylobacteriaceae bacterium]|jgi:hypothetical protein|nr:hypothetical protein [Methylobacteriaceae bacterium]
MTPLRLVRAELSKLGYRAVMPDYVFSDVFDPAAPERRVPLAAFTHSPPSYRNAAIGVVENAFEASDYRALGAPLLLLIQDDQVAVWQVRSAGPPALHARVKLEQLGVLFAENAESWNPSRIHAAKSFGALNRSYQLEFVDLGLLPAIEGQIHSKLDRLLNEALGETVRLRVIRPGEEVNDKLIFRTVFRLLAAKVLQDRANPVAAKWDQNDIDSVLKRIRAYYKLNDLPGENASFRGTLFETAWATLRGGINFSNISSDDLAFVYENTLVTEETREHFGVHSTPRPVAEYVLSRLDLSAIKPEDMQVYEPFAGAGVFMVAALGKMRDLLPRDMGDRERHNFLVKRLYGDELEPFAKEVAVLSLILADYPNHNGWAVSQLDLFHQFSIATRAQGATLVLCNPPFEKFTEAEKKQYPEAAARSARKPIAALSAVLDAKPAALGFVLPESFIDGQHYRRERERIETLYKDVEVVALPDRIFKASVIRSSLVIAQEPRVGGDSPTRLRSTVVSVRDRDRFLKTGEVSNVRVKVQPLLANPGRLWIDELDEIWEALAALPKLTTVAEVHRGIEWQDRQSEAIHSKPEEGDCLGIHSADSIHAFYFDAPKYLDCRPERLRGGAFELPWKDPKILANAARLSRGPWCFAAAVDRDRLVASQQLFGIWRVNQGEGGPSLNTLCALLNSPVAVAYISSNSPPDRIRVNTVKAVPIPHNLPAGIDELVERYSQLIHEQQALFSDSSERANRLLHEIDALVLRSYDLSPRMERRVLDYFRGEMRPTIHHWTHWFPQDFAPFIPLHEYVSGEYKIATGNWVSDLVRPLPEVEAAAIQELLD